MHAQFQDDNGVWTAICSVIFCAVQVKQLNGEKSKMGLEAAELQKRVAKDEEKDELNRKENFGLKQRVSPESVPAK